VSVGSLVHPVVHEVVICSTEGGGIGIGTPSVLLLNVTYKASILATVAVNQEHHREKLVFGLVTSLLSLSGGWQLLIHLRE
jgi:hypothetical protein